MNYIGEHTIDPPVCSRIFSLFTMKNLFQGISLPRIGEFVYDYLEIAFALMDRFFCPSQHRDIEAAQIHMTKMAFINMYYFETNTVIIG